MKHIILFIFISIYSFSVNAQKNNAADKLYKNFAYLDAAKLYKKALKKQDSSVYLLTRIGDCYYKNSDSEEALKWYTLASEKNESDNPKFMFKYIQTLRSVGKDELADEWLYRLKNYTPMDSIVLNSQFTNVKREFGDKPLLNLINLNSNTEYSDFGGYEDNSGQFYYSTSVKEEAILDNTKGKVYQWNEEPYLKIVQAEVSKSVETIEVGTFNPIPSDSINSLSNHQGTLAITKDGKTLYYTGSNVKKNNVAVYDKSGTNNLKIYRATLINGKWSNLEDLSINDKRFSTGHPTLSPDDKILYFVSDRPGGFGQSDLYETVINDDGSLGEVKNLGPKINTAGREMFPFMAADFTFYFSSDGYIDNNFGLLDIYKTDLVQKAHAIDASIVNLGPGFNSGYDDFAFFTNDGEKTGYLSSNRPGGKGGDDIYAFLREKCIQNIEGVVYDVLTNSKIVEAKVELKDIEGNVIVTTSSNKEGVYMFENLDCEKAFIITASKQRHDSDTKEAMTTNIPKGKVAVDLYLKPYDININPIYFDFDKSYIRPDAAAELGRVVAVMKEYPKMIIRIESHTDSRGKDSYNLSLSDRRAKSTRVYIVSQGIEANRIESAIGYGETRLVNRCSNEFRDKCTEEEHQKNRRSRFEIVNFETFDKE
ncbi:OmpA family protein [Mariniflexile sp. AS56]|uniref:OmpA family protein n=1 Tax=Mariniflexile sp. AS56 TaxID=3063957 RepID=UPI0026EAB31D|nr:OmpA family protein [Mariniflexile sp. AS56]MDO7172298.1 OmpA family protein [Mariniflexile sp. AS56]